MTPDSTAPDTTAASMSRSTAADEADLNGPSRTRFLSLSGWEWSVLGALVVALVVSALAVDGFTSVRNLRFLLSDVLPIALLALPMTLLIVTGEIDLSVASTLGFASALFGQLWFTGVPLELAVVVCILAGGLLGAVNGTFVTRFGLPSLAVTIGTLALYRGLALVVLGDRAVADFPLSWTSGVTTTIGSTPFTWSVLATVGLAAAFAVVLHSTPIGRGLYAMGANEQAARFTGINVRRVKLWLFVVTGMMAAVAGIYWTLRYSSARADNGTGLELAVVAAVLFGGVSIFGGRGSLVGVITSVLFLGVLQNALQLASVSADALTIVTGVLLILSVLAPYVITRVQAARAARTGGGISSRS